MTRVILATACLSIGACSSNAATTAGAPKSFEPVELAKAAIVLDEMMYSPSDLEVEAGQPLMLTITNPDDTPHEFILTTDKKTVHLFVNPGIEVVSSLTVPDPGRYTFVCEIDDHEERGMVGTLEVH